MNRLYRDMLQERVRYALAAANAATGLEHRGVLGAVREVLIADLLRPLVPPSVGVATGVVISPDDQQSRQQDIILFDPSVLPPLLYEQGPAVVPVEAALATIEVKSRLTIAGCREASEGARSLYALSMQSGIQDVSGEWRDVPLRAPLAILFALSSDLARDSSDAERYAVACPGPGLVRAICVANKGLWYAKGRVDVSWANGDPQITEASGRPTEWVREAVPACEAVLALLDMIHYNVMRTLGTRGKPPLRGYLRN